MRGYGDGNWVEDIRAAVVFLTRLPLDLVGRGEPVSIPAWPRLMRAFPLVGGLVGLIAGGVLVLAGGLGLAPLPAALLAVAAGIVVTGALHEDGLSDFADGLGGATRQRRLEIMRDSRTGAFGVLALVLVIALNATALAQIVGQSGLWAAAAALVAVNAASRLAAVAMLNRLPPARADGRSVEAGRPDGEILRQAALVAAVIAVVLLWPVFGLWPLFVATLAGWATTALMAQLAERTLGGQTGDVAGATEQLTRVFILLALAGAS